MNIAVLTSGNGCWSMTQFAILEECKLVFLGMEHKSKALAFLPTKWCMQNRKPVIPLSPELKEQCNFSKALEKFIVKSNKEQSDDKKLCVSPKMFYKHHNQKSVKRLGQWTICTRSSKTADKILKIQADGHTAAKGVMPKNPSPATSTPVNISTATKVANHIETVGNDIQTNIGQINFHLSNLNRNLMELSTSDKKKKKTNKRIR